MKYKIGIPLKNIVIFLKKEKVYLVPYTSNGLCTGCYFWPDKTGKMDFYEMNKKFKAGFHCTAKRNGDIPSCVNYSLKNIDVNVIFKEEKQPPEWVIPEF